MKYDEHDRDRARELRRGMNEAEAIIWNRLRAKRRHGFKFRRQHPLGPFVADLYCAAAKLVIELDGATHKDRREFDAMRDAWMTKRGITVLRFWNEEIFENLESVLTRIEAVCFQRSGGPAP